jgi:ubiquinone/menaquinone biosynthesis C-methylase UbiE
METVKRVSVQQGYDLWAASYDATPNPIVALDARQTIALLAPQPGERILDAGCGTGRNLAALLAAGAQPCGIDFSPGMLAVARQKFPALTLLQADLQERFPFPDAGFDAVLCALIGEHLSDLRALNAEVFRVLKAGGRYVFSVYHPQLAAAGKEANFERDGIDYRLGAYLHTTEDYLGALAGAGFTACVTREFAADAELVAAVPKAQKYLGQLILLLIQAAKA